MHGASIGPIGPSSSTTTRLSPGATRSSTATTSSDRVQGSVMTRIYTSGTFSTIVKMLVFSGSRTARWGRTPVPSVALTTGAMSGALPSAEGQASGEVFMAVREGCTPVGEVFMAAGAVL